MHRVFPLLLLFACSPAAKDWKKARSSATSEAYHHFLTRWPSSKQADEATQRLETVLWSRAREVKTVEAYEAYLRESPLGLHRDEARIQVRDLQLDTALDTGTPEELELLLVRYPDDPKVQALRDRIDDLRFRDAELDGSVEGYGRYLLQLPHGRHVAEARDRWDTLVYEAVLEKDELVHWREFVRTHPDNAHVERAKRRIQSIAFHSVRPVLYFQHSWRAEELHAEARKYIQQNLTVTVFAVLRQQGFKVLPVQWQEDPKPPKAQPGTAVFWLDYREKKGEAFEPQGQGTVITADLALYSNGYETPIWRDTAQSETGVRVRGGDKALYYSAMEQFGDRLAELDPDVAAFKAE